MALTRSFGETVARCARSDEAFRAALVEEAVQNILDGDMKTGRGQLRDVVNATIGFDALAAATGLPKTSLMRMLGLTATHAPTILAIFFARSGDTPVSISWPAPRLGGNRRPRESANRETGLERSGTALSRLRHPNPCRHFVA
jgi:hypothetical protein